MKIWQNKRCVYKEVITLNLWIKIKWFDRLLYNNLVLLWLSRNQPAWRLSDSLGVWWPIWLRTNSWVFEWVWGTGCPGGLNWLAVGWSAGRLRGPAKKSATAFGSAGGWRFTIQEVIGGGGKGVAIRTVI